MTKALQDTSDAPVETAERCDRCGGQAAQRVQLNAGDLYLCARHYRQHADALAQVVKVPRSL